MTKPERDDGDRSVLLVGIPKADEKCVYGLRLGAARMRPLSFWISFTQIIGNLAIAPAAVSSI